MSAIDKPLDAFKELVWDSVVKAAIARLFAKWTFLNWGPFAYIINHFVDKYSAEIYDALSGIIKFDRVIFRNEEFEKEFTLSAIGLHKIAKNEGIETTNFKEYREKHKKDLSRFVNFDIVRAS